MEKAQLARGFTRRPGRSARVRERGSLERKGIVLRIDGDGRLARVTLAPEGSGEFELVSYSSTPLLIVNFRLQ